MEDGAHTAAKHEILRRYLNAWFPILGSQHERVVFLDGFAGPGIYEHGEPGSPIIALRTLLEHSFFPRMACQFEFFFLESRWDRYGSLVEQLDSFTRTRGGLPRNIAIVPQQTTFEEAASAVVLERDRRHRELAPRIEVKDSAASTAEELSLVFTNRGQVDYDQVTVALDQADPRGPITNLLLEDAWVTEGTLGPLLQGIPRVVRYRRAQSPAAWIAHLRLTCRSGPHKWTTRIQVDVAPPIEDTIF